MRASSAWHPTASSAPAAKPESLVVLAAVALLAGASWRLRLIKPQSGPRGTRDEPRPHRPHASAPTTAPPKAYPASPHSPSTTMEGPYALHVGEHLPSCSPAPTGRSSRAPIRPCSIPMDNPSSAPQIGGCVPGQGCGTVTADFTASSTGTVDRHRHPPHHLGGSTGPAPPPTAACQVTVTVS